jgi:starch synthase
MVLSVYDDDFSGSLNPALAEKMKVEGLSDKDLAHYKTPDYVNLIKAAIEDSDAIIIGSEKINPEIEKQLKNINKPVLPYQDEDSYIDAYSEFYDEVLKA